MWFRKTHLMSKKPCELFYKPFFFEPGSCFLPKVNGTSTQKESVLFRILESSKLVGANEKGVEGNADSDTMNVPISNMLSIQMIWKSFFSIYSGKCILNSWKPYKKCKDGFYYRMQYCHVFWYLSINVSLGDESSRQWCHFLLRSSYKEVTPKGV